MLSGAGLMATKSSHMRDAIAVRDQRHRGGSEFVVRDEETTITGDQGVVRVRLNVPGPRAGKLVLADPRAVGADEGVVVFHLSAAFDLILETHFALAREVLMHGELALAHGEKRLRFRRE